MGSGVGGGQGSLAKPWVVGQILPAPVDPPDREQERERQRERQRGRESEVARPKRTPSLGRCGDGQVDPRTVSVGPQEVCVGGAGTARQARQVCVWRENQRTEGLSDSDGSQKGSLYDFGDAVGWASPSNGELQGKRDELLEWDATCDGAALCHTELRMRAVYQSDRGGDTGSGGLEIGRAHV